MNLWVTSKCLLIWSEILMLSSSGRRAPKEPLKSKSTVHKVHHNQFIFCWGMGACSLYTFYRQQMKENELTMKDSKILPSALSMQANQYVKHWFYKCSHSARHVCYNGRIKQCKMFSVSYVPRIFCDSERKRTETTIKHLSSEICSVH